MIAEIDDAYLRRMVELPGGWAHLFDLVTAFQLERDTARAIAAAVVRDAEPTRRRIADLLAANSALVQEKRDLRHELQAQIDAAHTELDQYRAASPPTCPPEGLRGLIDRIRVHAKGWRRPDALSFREPDDEAGLLEEIAGVLELIAGATA
ncbi:MAG TPA: hypothetical protein VFT56_01210 [Sphingomonas sp.]|nr:hypothetical protein [Sphingomonas sp.]